METAAVIEKFADVVSEHASKKQEETSSAILAKLKKVLAAIPASNFTQKQLKQFFTKRSEVVEFLVDQFFISKFTKQFALIDDELFKMKRYLMLRTGSVLADTTKPIDLVEKNSPDGKPYKKPKKINATCIETPLFVYVSLPPAENQSVDLGSFRKTSQRGWRRTTTKHSLSAKLPGEFTSQLQSIYSDAVAKTYRILAECYEELAEIQMQQAEQFEIGAIWIPTLKSINVKTEIKTVDVRPDPAMVLRLREKNFLIALWEVEEEKPIEHYIREFTTGGVNKVKNKKS